MARPGSISHPQRGLSLTEELERLEQSITLTLQEIDHNFSKAHRIVTSSILPVVEQYASHSKDVWEGSKFWKQFFESSAHVSLSGYEEQASLQEAADETATEDTNTITHTTLEETSNSYETPSAQHISTSSIADLDLSNLSMSPSHSTPRPSKKQGQNQAQPAFADYPSPYEALRQEVNNTTNLEATSLSQTITSPETPGRSIGQTATMSPEGSPSLPRYPASNSRPSTTRKRIDPVMHHILDKTYRIQATPLTSNRYRSTTPGTTTQKQTTRSALLDSTLSSSPEAPPPQLHAELFNSPERKRSSPRKRSPFKRDDIDGNRNHNNKNNQMLQQQRTPGVSVLTPARKKWSNTPPQVSVRTPGLWNSDDEDEDDFDEVTGMPYGASPPKTMQFHIPQSRLLKTPAKEASKRIVNDILHTAGISRPGPGLNEEDTDDIDPSLDIDADMNYDIDLGDEEGYEYDDEYTRNGNEKGTRARDQNHSELENSPSIVRRATGLDDEIF